MELCEATDIAGKPIWIPGGPPSTRLKYKLQLRKEVQIEGMRYSLLCTPYQHALLQVKNQINVVQPINVWDEFKKITNPCEFVFLSLQRRMSFSVADHIPLSRSYFKMLEIWDSCNLEEDMRQIVEAGGTFTTAHAAEGPGGFIEATLQRSSECDFSVKQATAITLRSTDKSIPGWRKTGAFLHSHPEVLITYGEDGTGDLLKVSNIHAYVEMATRKSPEGVALFTADGGFDFSADFNNQEESMFHLLIAELYAGLKVLRKGGVLVVKIFDSILQPTVDILFLVSRFFRTWTVFKPQTSRSANSERYLVAKGKLDVDESFFRLLVAVLQPGVAKNIHTIAGLLEPGNSEIGVFMGHLIHIQDSLAKNQIAAIRSTLELIQNPKQEIIMDSMLHNVQNSIQWCNIHRVGIRSNYLDAIITQEMLVSIMHEILCETMKPLTLASIADRRDVQGVRLQSLGLSQRGSLRRQTISEESVEHSSEVSQIDPQEECQQKRQHRVARFSRILSHPTSETSLTLRNDHMIQSELFQTTSDTSLQMGHTSLSHLPFPMTAGPFQFQQEQAAWPQTEYMNVVSRFPSSYSKSASIAEGTQNEGWTLVQAKNRKRH